MNAADGYMSQEERDWRARTSDAPVKRDPLPDPKPAEPAKDVYLFVGGPRDGAFLQVPPGISTVAHLRTEDDPSAATHYEAAKMYIGHKRWTFFFHRDTITKEHAMDLLLEFYRPPNCEAIKYMREEIERLRDQLRPYTKHNVQPPPDSTFYSHDENGPTGP